MIIIVNKPKNLFFFFLKLNMQNVLIELSHKSAKYQPLMFIYVSFITQLFLSLCVLSNVWSKNGDF